MSKILTNDKKRALRLADFLPWHFMDNFLNASFFNTFVDRKELARVDEYLKYSEDKFSEFSDDKLKALQKDFNESLLVIRIFIAETFFPLDHALDKLQLLPEKKISKDPELRKEYDDAFSAIEGLIDNCWGSYKKLISAIKDYIETLESTKSTKERELIRKLPDAETPSKTDQKKWESISMKFLNGHEIIIEEEGKQKQTNFEEMGFKNNKNNQPTRQWELLTALSQKGGEMSWRNNQDLSQKDIDAVKHRKKKLADQLKAYFRIDSDPFEYNYKEKAYRLKIYLKPEKSDISKEDSLGIQEYLDETMIEVNEEELS